MAELNVYVESALLEEIDKVAIKQYGDDSEISRQRVVETAMEMWILWSSSVAHSQDETEEAVSQWQLPESPANTDDSDNIRGWIFRRQ
jgi:hypothetical protein